jgi:hypothetical protein
MTTPSPKLPGKAEWAGRRRPMTRKSGFTTRGSGGELEIVTIGGYLMPAGASLTVAFQLPPVETGRILGFGGWFTKSEGISARIETGGLSTVMVDASLPSWGKFGSQWYAGEGKVYSARAIFTASAAGHLALYGLLCGGVQHEYFETARPELMTNMHTFAPEANFITPEAQGNIEISVSPNVKEEMDVAKLYLKSCNRCARRLPINVPEERLHLSFTNHCVAAHRRPCRHTGFGKLTEIKSNQYVQLDYGFQLECRICKKFEVNAAHNPQRTAAQMKEDGARRRFFEVLLDNLYQGTPQLRYTEMTGRELTDDVWERFDRRCFKCGTLLSTPRDMELDHTRPLALLWPLDETATSLCPTHNSEKRDRPPVDYYTAEELSRLSKITGIPLADIQDPSPNLEAIYLLESRIEWFMKEFLNLPALNREHDGKLPRDLLVKALNKVLQMCPGGPPFVLPDE